MDLSLEEGIKMTSKERHSLAYIIGVALGDGNLSNPNGRAVRLRITCDNAYPEIIAEIKKHLEVLFPSNNVSIVFRKSTYCDISVYSNKLTNLLPWKVGLGAKVSQKPNVPQWIFKEKTLMILCLRGLFQTDGSIYKDRGYVMLNFTNHIETLSNDVMEMVQILGYSPHIYQIKKVGKNSRYTVRLSKDVNKFLKTIDLKKEKGGE